MRRMSRVHAAFCLAATAGLVTGGLWLALSPATASARSGPERVLYSFAGANGAGPLSGVVSGPGGVLYGTTVFGGRHGDGCVFALTPTGSGYTERVLFSFDGADGAKPGGDIAIGAHGDLFGDTVVGGEGDGVVFELAPHGPGYAEKVLHSFTGGLDGNQPIATPVLDPRGDVFGITQFGGAGGRGVVYEMKSSPTGYTERVLHDFPNSGGGSSAGLTLDGGGTLYGYAGSERHPGGFLYRIQLGKGRPVFTDVFNFNVSAKDGNAPAAPVTVDIHTGVLYGTTQYGGTRDDGTVFSLTPSGSGYTEQVLHSFTSSRTGFSPQAPVLRTASGDLFSTTSFGGIRCAGIGCGMVIELTPVGSGYSFHEVYRFTGPPDGAEPENSGLAAGTGGELFGTTRSGGTARGCSDGGPGGARGCGTLYAITP